MLFRMEILIALGGLVVLGIMLYLFFSLASYPAKSDKKSREIIINRELAKVQDELDKGKISKIEYEFREREIIKKWMY